MSEVPEGWKFYGGSPWPLPGEVVDKMAEALGGAIDRARFFGVEEEQ